MRPILLLSGGFIISLCSFSQNVGIGTTTPSDKLTVQTGNGYGMVHTNGVVSVGTYVNSTQTAGAGWFGTKSNHPLVFFTNNGPRWPSLASF